MSEELTDKALTDFLEGKAEGSVKMMVAYLESVIQDSEPCICPECKAEIVAPASHNTRIAAVRALKELMIDKVKGNKRDRTPEEKGMDFKSALEEVAKLRQEKEAAGIKAGKVVKMPPPPVPAAPKKKSTRGHTLKEFRERQKGKK